MLGMSSRALLNRIETLRAEGYTIPESTYDPGKQSKERFGVKVAPTFTFTPLPSEDVPIEELIAHRKRQFAHKREHEEASKLIPIRIKIPGPIGIL